MTSRWSSRNGADWFERLRPRCEEACLAAGSMEATDVVLFYLARWCQKKAKNVEPDASDLGDDAVPRVAKRIVRNLAEDGARVEGLVAGDKGEWSDLERLLMASARPRAGDAARQYVQEARQKIAIVLLTGTPPHRAAERLRHELDGPANEYLFHAPFSFWAQSVVVRLLIDEHRRRARERTGPPVGARAKPAPQRLDAAQLREACDALPSLLDAISELPSAQRSAMALTLVRRDLDEAARDHLHELAPGLFAATHEPAAGDEEIAERLDTTAHRVAANRSAARRKLAKRDPRWELLLDFLLPHASTRPITAGKEPLAASAKSTGSSDD